MDFDLTDDQRLLREGVERLLAKEYGFERRRALVSSPEGWRRTVWKQLAELGLLALPFPEAEGGLGGGPVELMLVMESFGRYLVVEPFLASIVLAGGCLRHGASAAQRAAWLPAVMAGGRVLALAHGERGARYELARVATRARRSGGGWMLDGAKAFVAGGDAADQFVVSARTSGEEADSDGISLFLVDADAPGVSRRSYLTQDRSRAADIELRSVRLSGDRLLGAEGTALEVISRVADEAIAALCAEAVGSMERVHEITVDYLKQRKQFGVAIGSFQALQHRAVDMLVHIEQARSMTYYATMMLASEDASIRARALSAAKVQIGRSGKFVGEQAVQLHGGIGVTEECQAGHYYRRLTMIELTFGDTTHHLAALAAAGGVPDL